MHLGIHDVEQGQKEFEDGKNVVVSQQPYSSDSGDDAGPTPPESPVPSVGAFALRPGSLNLDDEFFAIPSSDGKPQLATASKCQMRCCRIPEEADLLHRPGGHSHLLRREEAHRVSGEVGQVRLGQGERLGSEARAVRETASRIHQSERDLIRASSSRYRSTTGRIEHSVRASRRCAVIVLPLWTPPIQEFRSH